MKEAEGSQDQEEKAGLSKKKKGPRRQMNIDNFFLGGGSSAYDLAVDVRTQGPNIT